MTNMDKVSQEAERPDSLEGHFHRRNEVHIMRKLSHLVFGISWLWCYYNLEAVNREVSIYMAFGLGAALFSADLVRMRLPRFNRFVLKVLGPLMRQSEARSFSGSSFYMLGIGLTLLLYQEEIAVLSIFFLVFSDPVSSYFGIRYGTNQIVSNKSIQGSTAGLCTCYLISLIYGLIRVAPTTDLLIFSLLAGVVGSVSELFSNLVDDNLAIPLVSGAGLSLLNLIFQIY